MVPNAKLQRYSHIAVSHLAKMLAALIGLLNINIILALNKTIKSSFTCSLASREIILLSCV